MSEEDKHTHKVARWREGVAVHVFRWPLQEVAATWALGFDLSIFNMFYNKARKFT